MKIIVIHSMGARSGSHSRRPCEGFEGNGAEQAVRAPARPARADPGVDQRVRDHARAEGERADGNTRRDQRRRLATACRPPTTRQSRSWWLLQVAFLVNVSSA